VSWRKILAWCGLAVAAVVVVAAVVYVVFWPLSDLIARHDVGSITGAHRAPALQAARDAARGRLIALGAGLFAAGALIYTARNFSLARQGQVTDRSTKAIEQLGSDKLDVRIGGIYALERIALDSVRDHSTVMEVLTAFVRGQPGKKPTVSATDQQTPQDEDPSPLPAALATPSDVRAAIVVIGRRNASNDRDRVELFLYRASLVGVNLRDANLAGAFLRSVDLTEAILIGANLARTNLRYARLHGADLTGANLHCADLTGAILHRARLTGADLTGADLTRAHLTGVRWPLDQPAPPGWQREPDAGRLHRAAGDPGDAAAE